VLELQHVGVTTLSDFEKEFFDCYARTFPYLIDKASVFIRLRGSALLSELGANITLEQFITLDAISANKTPRCFRWYRYHPPVKPASSNVPRLCSGHC